MGCFGVVQAFSPPLLPKWQHRDPFTFRNYLDRDDTKMNTSVSPRSLQLTSSYGPVHPLNLQNSFNTLIITFFQDWKNCPDVLKPTCTAPDGVNFGRFKAFSHTGFISHIPPPSRILFACSSSCPILPFFLDLFACKIFPDHSPELHVQPDLLPPTAGAGVTTQVLLIAKECQNCSPWLEKRKTASREQHPLGNLSFIRQEGHALITFQSWCAIPLLGWRLTPRQPWPFAAQQNLLLKRVLPLY